LAWTIRQRARLAGRIEKLRAELAHCVDEKLAALQELEAQLRALDATFALHEIQVNPQDIKPVRAHDPAQRIPFAHGMLTRLILACLREAQGEPRDSAAIVEYILARTDYPRTPEALDRLSAKVRKRLNNLGHQQRVERLHPLKTGRSGRWRLAETEKKRRA
jgi:hypothetical protein